MRQLPIAATLSLFAAAGCRSQPAATPRIAGGEHERTMGTSVGGQQLSYLLHVPVASDVPPDGWPLLLFLHGAGERGDDLSLVRVHGPPKLTGEIPELSRCVVVAPQCPSDAWWKPETLEALLDEVRALTLPDPTRIYVTGLSMGGYGTWGLLASSPDTFAAAVPICGGGDPCRLWQDRVPAGGFDLDELLRAKDVPIHAFHGASDSVVPADESRMLVRALEAVEASVRLTVYPGVGHDSWTQTYADPALYAWMFAQKRETE